MTEFALTVFCGGTFDPIHYGHLQQAIAIAHLINLERVILLPNKVPPHRSTPEASPLQRLEMIKLSIADSPGKLFTLDDREIQRDTKSWTVETFELLRREYGYSIPLGFIIGQDSLLTLPKWYRSRDLPSLCHIIVSSRFGYKHIIPNMLHQYHWLTNRLTKNHRELHKHPSGLIYCAETPTIAISSSEIRRRYHEGISCDGLLPPAVQDYIDEQGLYR